MLFSLCSFALEPFKVTYTVKKGLIKIGTITRSLEIDGNNFVFTSLMEPSGITNFVTKEKLFEESKGIILDKNITTVSYIRETNNTKKDYTLKFFNQAKSVSRDDIEKGYNDIRETKLFDKLSYQAQLMIDLSQSPNSLSYDIAAKDEVVNYIITNEGLKKIKTPMGKMNAVAMTRKDPNSKKQSTIYCAEKLNWLPLRIDHVDKKGKKMTAIIESFSP